MKKTYLFVSLTVVILLTGCSKRVTDTFARR